MFGSTTVYKPIIASMWDSSHESGSMWDSSHESRYQHIFFITWRIITFLSDSLCGRFMSMMSIIHLNGTSSSEWRNSLCWHTKGHLWIEGCLKHYRWAYYELHLSSIQVVIFTFEYVKCCTRLILYATRVHTRLLLKHVACCTWVSVIASRVQICTQVPLRETRVSYAGCQY